MSTSGIRAQLLQTEEEWAARNAMYDDLELAPLQRVPLHRCAPRPGLRRRGLRACAPLWLQSFLRDRCGQPARACIDGGTRATVRDHERTSAEAQ